MQRTFEILPAYDPAVVSRAVAQNSARGFPLYEVGRKSGPISVCGNGPSLRETFPRDGLPICALNGAWRALAKHGITPDYICAFDPTPESVAWFKDCPDSPVYLIGSRMVPEVFEALAGKRVQIWHMLDDIEHKLNMPQMIGAGNFIGCHAINLLASMGFRHFELYGYDSCYASDGAHHAAPQPWHNKVTKLSGQPQPFQVGERMFIAEPWMAAQVEDFLSQVENNRFSYTVNVNGDGFLKSALDHNTLEAVYNLDYAPGSWDFLWSMCNIENYRRLNGYSRVKVHFKAGRENGFRPGDPIELDCKIKAGMMNNITRPLLKCMGFEETAEISDKAIEFGYSPKAVLEVWKETKTLPKFYPSVMAQRWVKQFKKPYITITLREAEHWNIRNSNVPEWVKFAQSIKDYKVIFVRDTAKAYEPIADFEICPNASKDVDYRLALYRNARMNFFVENGPCAFVHCSNDIPYIIFNTTPDGYVCNNKEWWLDYFGHEMGSQVPWANPKIQWKMFAKDTFENISRCWREMQ